VRLEVRRFVPRLVYLMSEDGTAFSTFLAAGAPPGCYIMLVQTVRMTVGAFLGEPLDAARKGYYGRGSMFVFDADRMVCFRANLRNHLYMAVSNRDLMIGGPNPAIMCEDQFVRMGSSECETFGSPPFAESAAGDQILEVELYRLWNR
jgi:hypothetical protein